MFEIDAQVVTIVRSATIRLNTDQVTQLAAVAGYYLPIEPRVAPTVSAVTPGNGDGSKRKKHTTTPCNIDAEWLREQYSEKMRSTIDIGRELGCANNTVGAYLRKYGIPARKASRPAVNP